MNEATLAATLMSLLLFLIFLGFLIWAIRSGQLKNVEEAKYHVFRNEKPVSGKDNKSAGKNHEHHSPAETKENL